MRCRGITAREGTPPSPSPNSTTVWGRVPSPSTKIVGATTFLAGGGRPISLGDSWRYRKLPTSVNVLAASTGVGVPHPRTKMASATKLLGGPPNVVALRGGVPPPFAIRLFYKVFEKVLPKDFKGAILWPRFA